MNLKNRHGDRRTGIPVSAMSDIAFLLLIFIMVVVLISHRLEVNIDYAEARSALNMTADQNMEIWIDRDGGLFIDGHPANLLAVEDAIVDMFVNAPETRIHIIADRHTPYKNVNSVLEILQLLQYRTVSFVVRNID
ncbi:MAG: biopolymer transporter ExbD [Treponema sp.]|nr:biopolymer transporter ExbD [Treponema sp.]